MVFGTQSLPGALVLKCQHSEFVGQLFCDTPERRAVAFPGRNEDNGGPLTPLLAVPIYPTRAVDE